MRLQDYDFSYSSIKDMGIDFYDDFFEYYTDLGNNYATFHELASNDWFDIIDFDILLSNKVPLNDGFTLDLGEL